MVDEYECTTLFVDFYHIVRYNQDLADAIFEEFYRYEPYLRNAVEALVDQIRKSDPERKTNYFISIYNYNRVSK